MKRRAGDGPGAPGVAQRGLLVERPRRRPGWPGRRVADAALGGRCRLGVGVGKAADREGLGWRPGWWVWRGLRGALCTAPPMGRADGPACDRGCPQELAAARRQEADVRLEPLWNEHCAGLRRPRGGCAARRAGLAWGQSSREAAEEGMGGRGRICPIGPIGLMRPMRMGRMRPMGRMGPGGRRGAFPARGGGHARLLGWACAWAPAWLGGGTRVGCRGSSEEGRSSSRTRSRSMGLGSKLVAPGSEPWRAG